MVRQQVLSENNKNYFTFTLLLIMILGITWGALVGVNVGILYLTIFLSTIGIIVLAQLFTNSNDKKTLNEFFKTPFVGSSLVASAMWLMGISLIIITNTVGGIFKQGFSTVQFFSPLYLSAGTLVKGSSQTFSASIIENSDSASLFYGVFVAGTNEEFTWAFALPLAFWMVAILINNTVFNGKFGKTFYFWFSTFFSVLTFMVVHTLNDSYVGGMFIVAGIFRFLMIFSTYRLFMGMSFLFGIHQTNNVYAWINQNGFGKFIEIMFTNIYGIIFVLLFVAIIINVFKNIDKVWIGMKKEWNN